MAPGQTNPGVLGEKTSPWSPSPNPLAGVAFYPGLELPRTRRCQSHRDRLQITTPSPTSHPAPSTTAATTPSTSKPTQPGLHLTHRTSYYAEESHQDDARRPHPHHCRTGRPRRNMQAAMSRSMPTSTDLLFDVQVEPSTEPPKPTDPPILGTLDPKLAALSSKNGKHLTRYGFEYVLPARQIAFHLAATPEGNRRAGLVPFRPRRLQRPTTNSSPASANPSNPPSPPSTTSSSSKAPSASSSSSTCRPALSFSASASSTPPPTKPVPWKSH